MNKLATLVFLGTVAFGANAQAFLGFGNTCAPTMKMQRMEQICTPCGVTCCPKLGFWYNY